jgi:anti-sigma B factor antagonist
LPLLLMRKGDPEMVSVELSTRECDGQVVVVLRGELDVAEAAKVAASLAAVAARGRNLIVDLEGLEFIDSSGLAALVRARRHARRAGFDLLLAAPQHQVLRMLAITRLIDVFAVHACVDEAARIAGRIPVVIPPESGNPVLLAMATKTSSELLAAGDAA